MMKRKATTRNREREVMRSVAKARSIERKAKVYYACIRPCGWCNGAGVVPCVACDDVKFCKSCNHELECMFCDGDGEVECSRCNGNSFFFKIIKRWRMKQ